VGVAAIGDAVFLGLFSKFVNGVGGVRRFGAVGVFADRRSLLVLAGIAGRKIGRNYVECHRLAHGRLAGTIGLRGMLPTSGLGANQAGM
jgi:hypothetical protein